MPDYIIYPEVFGNEVRAFFTGRSPGADMDGLAEISGVSRENIYFPGQEHTAEVVELGADMSVRTADAVITARRDVLIGVQVADCVPILLYARDSGLIGVVHAGWRGTAKGVLKTALRKMLESSSAHNIFIAIGPAIRECCYEVKGDVLKSVKEQTGGGGYHIQKGGRLYLDLPIANRHQALSLGIPMKNIWLSEECTYCQPDRFYSYRYSKGPTGRQGGFIMLIKEA